MKSKIEQYEKEYRAFNPFNHFKLRIKDMENKSDYGAEVAMKWSEVVSQNLMNETYPAVHPIGQETFSLFAEFSTGIFEYALDIDGATSLIKDRNIKPVTFSPSNIFKSVDQGNINKDPNRIKPNHKNPVMVIKSKYLTDDRKYCINGNHRILKAYRKNDEQIKVFVFNDLEFIPFFYDVISKAMYFLEIDYDNVMNGKRNFISNEKNVFVYD
ncbi:hypothetical protein ACFSKI_01315 [Pseudogracilibacillus auburnensis]|uniref:Uncharacterized protein n=1 Tax=Pseudogracilibacillus auburnensis TaxID=1494959 RepID=A0A2V3VFT9_9BACI|nr:hypothetical protein [Pseudogracilibacillus auburnensis]MBO1002489.1 hypothetical protein [Pseudogracilibacillus auburnensis]PXW80440.1 hypothetical protein DFR56_12710 [Pseudogracilibacillus auburnensis]